MGPMIDQRAPGSFAEVLQRDPEAWAIRISARWRMGVEAIISTGKLLLEAKAALPHGAFGRMLADQLPFKERQAQMLMAIASDARLSNPQYVALLPPSWGTIYDVTRLSDDEFTRAIEAGVIRPDMERKDIERIRPRPIQSSDGSGLKQAAGTDDLPAEALQWDVTSAAQPDSGASSSAGTIGRKDAGDAPGPSEALMPGGGLSIAHSRVEPAESLDFFPTPPWATRALIERVFVHLERRNHCQFQVCWEPACGEGHMAEPLKEYFREVVASDVKDYCYGDHTVDFLQCEQLARKYDADWIITNPPFGENTDKFILKALDMAGTGVAMLVRLQCLETVGRYEKIFRDTPPTLISFFVERVPMHKGRWEPDGDTMTAYIWLTWIKGAKPQAPFWIPPGCREALTRPEDAARFGAKPAAEAAA